MPLEFITIPAESQFGTRTANTLMTHIDPPSEKLLIMLPGRGYTTEHPVMYTLRRMAVANSWDVVSIQYGFQVNGGSDWSGQVHWLQEEIMPIVQQVLASGYQQVCVAGKSLGTLLAVWLAPTIPAAQSLLLLTPIQGAAQLAGDIATLAIIGSRDPYYNPALPDETQHMPNVTWRVYDDLNHRLEYAGDWQASLNILSNIIAACEDFLLRQSKG